jgi:hypothetical protein
MLLCRRQSMLQTTQPAPPLTLRPVPAAPSSVGASSSPSEGSSSLEGSSAPGAALPRAAGRRPCVAGVVPTAAGRRPGCGCGVLATERGPVSQGGAWGDRASSQRPPRLNTTQPALPLTLRPVPAAASSDGASSLPSEGSSLISGLPRVGRPRALAGWVWAAAPRVGRRPRCVLRRRFRAMSCRTSHVAAMLCMEA